MINKKIVTLGGGTGSYTLLMGLKKYSYDISSIVTMADDGGSTGVLRDELGVLPPGDVRQCLVALSDSTLTLRELMNYRFDSGNLNGHSFGNLFLSALEKITGSFSEAVVQASKILNVKGQIFPVSESDMRLDIVLKNGKVLEGEKELDDNAEIAEVGISKIKLRNKVSANKGAVKAIEEADYIIIGPGDHYGSILPNLLVEEISQAINKSNSKVFFVCPLTNKKGHTDGFTMIDYVREIEKYIGKWRVDDVFFNNATPSPDLVKKYEEKEGKGSIVSLGNVDSGKTFNVVAGNYLQTQEISSSKGDKIAHTRSFIRHDSAKLAHAISFAINNNNMYSIEIF